MEVLLFGGTSEGRTLALWLAEQGWQVTLCVATEYGAALAPDAPGIHTVTGRLDQGQMAQLMASRPFHCVIDATHPYAAVVTENIRRAAEETGCTYRRLLRDGDVDGDWLHASSIAHAAELLAALPGNILLTTGSKELAPFSCDALRDRSFPRVLPSLDSLESCLRLGFPPAHIICMQGPFSQELNAAMIRQLGIDILLTKASGGAGGFWDKVEAARETGCRLMVIDRPLHEEGLDLEALKSLLKQEGEES
jgi:precorrin-6A/cobalt-precorrin-6A reductase